MHLNRIDALLVDSSDAVRVPLIGQALCAGFPSPADDFVERVRGVRVFSSNYTLYGDMSGRTNAVHRQFSPQVEVSSIDERWPRHAVGGNCAFLPQVLANPPGRFRTYVHSRANVRAGWNLGRPRFNGGRLLSRHRQQLRIFCPSRR